MIKNEITYLCMTDPNFGRDISFRFMEDVAGRFHAAYGARAKSAFEGQLQTGFFNDLSSQMVLFAHFLCLSTRPVSTSRAECLASPQQLALQRMLASVALQVLECER